MIKSLTGYGKVNYTDENLNLDIEIRSVNSRYLDMNIRMPNQLLFLEDKITKQLKSIIKRGRVEVYIRSKNKNLATSKIHVDEKAVLETKEAFEKIAEIADLDFDSKNIELKDLLFNSDILVFEPKELDDKYLEEIILSNIDIATSKLLDMKIEEGSNLEKDLINNVNLLKDYKDEIEVYAKDIKEEIKEKLLTNIEESLDTGKIDQDRLANEIIYYADKSDINEELTRLDSHFKQFINTINSSDSSGKKLDFITQEFLRETNTIASKSSKIEITNISIEMKTIIEKIKEQVQNVE